MTDDTMTKERRMRAILQFLEDNNLALPPKAVYVNMERRGATFSEKTVYRHLREMEDEGLVRRLDEAETHFEVTDEGRDYLKSTSDT